MFVIRKEFGYAKFRVQSKACRSRIFQGYLSRQINIFTINGNYNVYPLHVDSQNLYCTENGTMLAMIVPLGHITSIQCVI